MDDQTFQAATQQPSRSIASQTSTTEQHWLLDEALQSNQPKLDSTLVALPLGLVAVWAIALAFVRQQQRQKTNNGLSHDDRHGQRQALPCRSCRFFKDNPYLKCAANPVDALTQRAIGCADYAPSVPHPQRRTSSKQG